jgi:hypothetical protein
MTHRRFVFKGNNPSNAAIKHGFPTREKNNGAIRDSMDMFTEINIGLQKRSDPQNPIAEKITDVPQKRELLSVQ